MVVGEFAEAIDLVVVGGGPGGYASALWAAQAGREVMLVERRGRAGLGGVCLIEGCIPSKALIDLANLVEAEAGRAQDDAALDMSVFQKGKNDIVRQLSDGVGKLLDANRVSVVPGDLRFTRPGQAVIRTPEDQARFVEFSQAIVAPGSRPAELADLPRDGERVLDSTDLLAREELPKDLVVVGDDYVGLELGTACAKLGTKVTIVGPGSQLLPTMGARLAKIVSRRLKELGVDVFFSSRVRKYDGSVALIEREKEERRVEADAVLVSVGRRPNTDELGLDTLGITPLDDGLLDVASDRRLDEKIAAIGDVTPGPALAHKATAEAAVAVDALCGRPAKFQPKAIPVTVFSDPEIASAGLTMELAVRQGIDAEMSRFSLRALGRPVATASKEGFAEIVTSSDDGTVLGVHLAGAHACELIAEGVLAIEMGATAEDLSLCIHPHPTFSEMFSEVGHVAVGRPLHSIVRAHTASGDGR